MMGLNWLLSIEHAAIRDQDTFDFFVSVLFRKSLFLILTGILKRFSCLDLMQFITTWFNCWPLPCESGKSWSWTTSHLFLWRVITRRLHENFLIYSNGVINATCIFILSLLNNFGYHKLTILIIWVVVYVNLIDWEKVSIFHIKSQLALCRDIFIFFITQVLKSRLAQTVFRNMNDIIHL